MVKWLLLAAAVLVARVSPVGACLTCKCEPLPDGTCCCVHPGCPPIPPSCPPPPNNSATTSSGDEWRRDANGVWRRTVAANVSAPKPDTTAGDADADADAPKPHIVFVVVDDMGYHNIRAPPLHMNSEISSPTLQRFAAEGITLSSYYAYKYCGPSRASLLTGRFPGHGISEGMFSSASPRAYNGNLTLLPAKLRTVGYRTHGIGKWHLGYYKRRFLPTSRGFMTWLGYLSGAEDHFTQATGDMCIASGRVVGTDLWADYGNGSQPAGGDNALGSNGTYSGYIYSRRAVEVITEHGVHYNEGGTPLFLYLALHNIHGPDEVTPEFLAQYDPEIWPARRTIDAMVSAVDSTLANVSAALTRSGMEEDTLTIVVSDNGGPIQEPGGSWSPGNNFPSRGGKYSLFEGGIKVVGMLTWPRMLKKHPLRIGSVWDGLMAVADWWPVLCGVAGADPDDTGPGKVPVDGINVFPALLSDGVSPRTELIIGMGAVRDEEGSQRPIGSNGALRVDGVHGKLKLIVGRQRAGTAWVGSHYPNASTPNTTFPPPVLCTPCCLFNLSDDLRESTDLHHAQPQLAAAMLQRWNFLAQTLIAPNEDGSEDPDSRSKVTDPAACATMLEAGGWWRPWAGE
jgi:arylsulfatase B